MPSTNSIKNLSIQHISSTDFLAKELVKTLNALIISDEWKSNHSFHRAAARAVAMLNVSEEWDFDGEFLRVTSDTSGIRYRGVTAQRCICESFLENRGFCKHRAGFILLKTMAEQNETGAGDEFALEVGTRFRVRGNVYKGKAFVVRETYGAGNMVCDCPQDKGVDYHFAPAALAYYGIQILSSEPEAEIPKVKVFPVGDESRIPYLPPSSNRKPEIIGGARV